MENKTLTIFTLLALAFPFSTHAFALPTANLTIIVNTQGQDTPFIFDFSGGTKFTLSTQNLSATKSVSIAVPASQYSLTQESVLGLNVNSVNCTSDNSADVFSYTSNGANFSPKNKENIICTFNDVQTKTPVLIVPGLLGTEMNDSSELLWADVSRMLSDSSDNFMDSLAFNQDLTASNSNVSVSDVIRKETILGREVSDYTDGLINEFESQGYVENQTLFTFPYDWRYGVTGTYPDGSTNSDLLATKIQDILTQTGAGKVDIVAHSLGGLIVKQYVMNHPTDNNIDKAVFVGVPNLGAPYAIKVLLQGDSFDISFAGFGLNPAEIQKISANMPAAYDLLPSQQYYNAKGSFVETITKDASGNFTTTQNNLNYQDFQSYITNDHGLNSEAMANAVNLHTADFDNFDMRNAGVDVYAIDGCKTATINTIVEDRQDSVLGSAATGYKMVTFKDGDNTVPIESADNLPINSGNVFYLLQAKHSNMMTQDGSKEEIVNLISGSNLAVNQKFITQDATKCAITGKVISKHSPVNMLATDQDGNQSGIAADGSLVNDIPGADYEAFGDQGFLFLPTDGGQTYSVTLQGTDTGSATIDSQDVVNNEVTATQIFSDVPVTADLTGAVNLGATGTPTTLTLTPTSGSGSQTLAADANLAGDFEDFSPPVSVATLNGTQDTDGNYTGEVDVNINASDENSGVLDVQYNLDNAGWQKVAGDSADIVVFGDGNHAVLFFGADNAGNNEAVQTLQFTIKAPVVVAPVAASSDVTGGGNSFVSGSGGSGGGASSAAALLPAIPTQASQNTPQNIIAAPAVILKNPVLPNPVLPNPILPNSVTPTLVSSKKPAKILANIKPKKTVVAVVKNSLPKTVVAVNNTTPATLTQNTNPFLASLYEAGSWIMKLIFGR